VGTKFTTPSVARQRVGKATPASHKHNSTDCAAPAVAPIAYHVTTSLAPYAMTPASLPLLATDDRYASEGSVAYRLPVVATKAGKCGMRSSMR